jgi:PAS domain S-box-containing protein
VTTPPDAKPATILIAASCAADLGELPYALGQRGMQMRLVGSADSAAAALGAGDIDLIMADINLPGSSGFALCSAIKTADSTRHLPVFLMTHAANPTERQRSSECGASAYLVKPFNASVVADQVRAQLALCSRLVIPQPQPLAAPDPALQALQVNYRALLVNSPDAVMLVDADNTRLLDVNRNTQQLFGLDERALLSRPLAALCPPFQSDGESSQQAIDGIIARVLAGEIRVFEATFLHASGRQVACELRLVLLPTSHRRLLHLRVVDVTRRIMAERLRSGQGMLLEMIARGAPLHETLERLMLLIESQSAGVLCSVLLLDDDGMTVRPAAGPSLPPAYMAALDGLQIGPAAGSCGTAMFRKETVIVSDILRDPLWAPYRDLVAQFDLRACWSTPIYLDREHVLGSFAMYYREVRSPHEDDMTLIAVATHLAGIAIERTRRERELAQHREHLEVLVDARTVELSLAKSRAEMASADLTTALANLSLAQEELVRRDKLAALGTLVAGIAHELNTPIGNSLVTATTMAERTQAFAAGMGGGVRRSTLNTYLAQTEQANAILVRNLTRAADLVASFKQVAVDHTSAQRRHFSLSDLLAELVPALAVLARADDVSVAAEVEPELQMDSYPGPLTQVLTNLFDNCLVHAFDGGGGSVRVRAGMRTRETVSVAIADDGAGIAPALLARVYDPFFTTKLGSGGSGLGLNVAHNIVTASLGGRIELSSVLGEGSTFTLLLPVVAPAAPIEPVEA